MDHETLICALWKENKELRGRAKRREALLREREATKVLIRAWNPLSARVGIPS